MAAIPTALLEKMQSLPPQRMAEVEDFVEFLALREARTIASSKLIDSLAKLDALQLPPITEEDIEAEIQAVRQERHASQR
jgi:hypothetical protein